MIESFTIEGFKSYKSAELKLAPLTVLVGANASGKSNALEAIRFLSWIAQGQKLSSLQFEINQNNAAIRGQLSNLFHERGGKFSIACKIDSKVLGFSTSLKLTFDLRTKRELHIYSEILDSEKHGILYQTTGPTEDVATDISVSYRKFKQGKWPSVVCSDQLGIFTQICADGKLDPKYKTAVDIIVDATREAEFLLSRILFLDPSPQAMREYSFLQYEHLKGNGSNLSAVLHELIHPKLNEIVSTKGSFKKEILDFIRSLPEQDIIDIDFLNGPRGEVMVTLTENFGGKERVMDAGLLSDGTLRVLAIAAALLSAPKNSIVIIEEIDNGIHPSRAKVLLNQIYKVAKDRNLRIVLSTHNPALMDALPFQAIQDVVFSYRDPDDGSSKLVALKDVPDYPELIAQGSLGDLVTRGVLSDFVKNYEGIEAKKAKALQWLESIK
jgi:predicted ATPase